jgi:hypothetical protein
MGPKTISDILSGMPDKTSQINLRQLTAIAPLIKVDEDGAMDLITGVSFGS